MVKNEKDSIIQELERIKKLLVLQLSQSDISIPYIAKAAEMSPNEIYKFIQKKRTKSMSKKSK